MAASRKGAAEEGVPSDAWRRVSPLTPALTSWRAFAILVALIAFQNLESILELQKFASRVGVGRVVLVFLGSVLLVLVVIGLYSYLAWRAMTYALTDQAVWLRAGIVFRRQRYVRLERIQAVDVTHPLLGRIFGLGRLNIQAAGGGDSSLKVEYLPTSTLTALRADILARAAGKPKEEPAVEAGENTVYAVSTPTLVFSLLLSPIFVGGLIFLIASAAAITIIALNFAGAALFGLLPIWLPMIIVSVAVLWSQFAGEFNFQVAVSPDGIRIRRGLLEQRAETIPPRRVHAVEIRQPILWRHRGWYRVVITQATGRQESPSNKSAVSHVLLPVGTRAEAMLAVWLVLPDLGVEDPTAFFAEALQGKSGSPSFVGIARGARLLDPLVWRRRGVALTHTCAVIRDGWMTRTTSFIPYERIQSIAQFQGPLERSLRVSGIRMCLVPGPVGTSVPHLPVVRAAQIRDELVERSHRQRSGEPAEKWFQRVHTQARNDGEEYEDGSE